MSFNTDMQAKTWILWTSGTWRRTLTTLSITSGYYSSTLWSNIFGTLFSRERRVVLKLTPGSSHMIASRLDMEVTWEYLPRCFFGLYPSLWITVNNIYYLKKTWSCNAIRFVTIGWISWYCTSGLKSTKAHTLPYICVQNSYLTCATNAPRITCGIHKDAFSMTSRMLNFISLWFQNINFSIR